MTLLLCFLDFGQWSCCKNIHQSQCNFKSRFISISEVPLVITKVVRNFEKSTAVLYLRLFSVSKSCLLKQNMKKLLSLLLNLLKASFVLLKQLPNLRYSIFWILIYKIDLFFPVTFNFTTCHKSRKCPSDNYANLFSYWLIVLSYCWSILYI